jgi:hypothetical protein
MKTKHLLGGVAVIAALALSAPAWAQPANPSGRMPAGGRATSGERIPAIMPETSSPPPSASDTTSATPPKHHHAHASAHGKVASHHPSHFPKVQGNNSANALNQAELSRLQTGSSMPPPTTPMPSGATMTYPPRQPPTQGGNSMGMPGPNMGGPGLTPYSAGAPPR